MHIRPLLHLLILVGDIDSRVCSSMPNLYPRIRACIPRIALPHDVAPLLRGVADLPARTRIGGERGLVSLQAAHGDACKYGACLDEVGVGTGQGVGHHGARGGAGDENLVAVDAPLLESVAHCVRESEGVAPAVVYEGGGADVVPAVVLVCCRAVEDDESTLVCELPELGAAEVRLGCATTVMQRE